MKRIFYFLLILFFSTVSVMAQPVINGVLVPQFMGDTTRGVGENARTHVIVRAKITGLTASATYRYQTKAVAYTDAATGTGAGNALYLRQTGSFSVTSGPSLASFGNYDSLLANAAGEYEGWFGIEPTANARFAPGNYIKIRVILNSGVTGNSTNTYFLTVSDSIKTMTYSSASSGGTGVWGKSLATDKNLAVLWDNVQATGRPLTCAIIENDGFAMRNATSPTNYPLYLRNNVDTISGAWGGIIPNNNANGVRRVDHRKLSDGSIVYANVDADGIWPTGNVSTVNPSGGYSAIKLDSSDVPLMPNPTLFFEQTAYSVNENGGSIVVGVKYKNPSFASTSVDIVLKTGGSATSGSDFTYSTNTLTFTPTDTMKTITVQINDDILVEGNETIILGLRNPTNGGLLRADSISTITILDDDLISPLFYFEQKTYVINESGPAVSVVVRYKNQAATPTSVDVSVKTGGSAVAGSDYTFSSTTLNFIASDTAKTIVIPITNDVLVEGNESFILRLSNQTAGCAFGNDSTTTVTIIDDDFASPVVSMSLGKQTVGEGAGTVAINVRLSAPAPSPVNVNISAINGTATTADYTFSNSSLTFNIGDTMKTASVTINDDAVAESTEYFVMQISSPIGATLGNANDTVSITDNDYPRLPIGQISTVNAVNGVADSLGKKYDEVGIVYGINYRPAGLQFVIRDNTGGITVFKATGGYGYTVKQGDSVRVPGTVAQFNGLTEFNADTVIVLGTNKTIKTPVIITKLVEANENDLVRMNGVRFDVPITTWPTVASNISVHNATDTMIIRLQLANADILGTAAPTGAFDIIGLGSQFDNTNPFTSGYQLFPRFLSDIIASSPTITMDVAPVNVSEGAGNIKVKLKISNVNSAASTVNITNTGTATSGTDYTGPGASATFPASAVNGDSIMLTYTITDDALVEGNETIIVGLTAGTNATVVGASKTITITDNDVAAATLKIDTATLSVNENVGTVKVKVKISNVNGTATTATLAFTGTATSGSDYTAPASTITFPATAVNGDSIMVSYVIINDILYEPTQETIITTYTAGANCAISGGSVQTIRIIDNDPNGINSNYNHSSVKIYPNPSSGTITIESNEELQNVKLFDLLGHEIMAVQPSNKILSLHELASGLYILEVQTKAGIVNERIIVK